MPASVALEESQRNEPFSSQGGVGGGRLAWCLRRERPRPLVVPRSPARAVHRPHGGWRYSRCRSADTSPVAWPDASPRARLVRADGGMGDCLIRTARRPAQGVIAWERLVHRRVEAEAGGWLQEGV
jgi:hypothetical protein